MPRSGAFVPTASEQQPWSTGTGSKRVESICRNWRTTVTRPGHLPRETYGRRILPTGVQPSRDMTWGNRGRRSIENCGPLITRNTSSGQPWYFGSVPAVTNAFRTRKFCQRPASIQTSVTAPEVRVRRATSLLCNTPSAQNCVSATAHGAAWTTIVPQLLASPSLHCFLPLPFSLLRH